MNVKWIVFNVVVALLPIGLTFAVVRVFHLPTRWFEVLKDGELFIYSTTLSASAIGAVMLDSKLQRTAPFVAFWFLVLMLMFSTVLFGVSSYLKLTHQSPAKPRVVSASSVVCAVLVSAASYYLVA